MREIKYHTLSTYDIPQGSEPHQHTIDLEDVEDNPIPIVQQRNYLFYRFVGLILLKLVMVLGLTIVFNSNKGPSSIMELTRDQSKENGRRLETFASCGINSFWCSSSSNSHQPQIPGCACCCYWNMIPSSSGCGCESVTSSSTSPPTLSPTPVIPSQTPSLSPTSSPTGKLHFTTSESDYVIEVLTVH